MIMDCFRRFIKGFTSAGGETADCERFQLGGIMMKIRARKLLALLLAASMMTMPGTSNLYAESTESQTAQATEAPKETAPATEAPKETAPETQAQTAAPETQAQTAAPETQAQTAAPVTEAQTGSPATETQTQAATEAKTTEKQTQKESEKETEKDEKKVREFTARHDKITVKITLPKGEEIVKSAEASVSVSAGSDDKDTRSKVRGLLNKGGRFVKQVYFYKITLKDDGKALTLPKGTKIEYSKDGGFDQNFDAYSLGKVTVLDVSGKAAAVIDAGVTMSDGGTKVSSVSFTAGKGFERFAIAAVENHVNDGDAVSDVTASFGEAGQYAAVAHSFSGKANGAAVRTDASGQTQSGEAASAGGLLKDLSALSLKLANTKSGDGTVVVNLYADDKGSVAWDVSDPQDPMKQILTSDGKIDVSGRTVILNIVAAKADGSVTVPHFDVTDGDKAADKDNSGTASRFIVNVTALANGRNSGEFALVPFTGSADVAQGTAAGVFLAPEASLDISGSLVGAAYADSVSAAKLYSDRKEEKTAEETAGKTTEQATEKTTEQATEKAAGQATEKAAEQVTEAASETESEAAVVPETMAGTSAPKLNGTAAGGLAAGQVTVTKVLPAATPLGMPIAGAVMELYDATTNTLLHSWTSSVTNSAAGITADQEDISTYLQAGGLYLIREVMMPMLQGTLYQQPGVVTFSVDGTGAGLTAEPTGPVSVLQNGSQSPNPQFPLTLQTADIPVSETSASPSVITLGVSPDRSAAPAVYYPGATIQVADVTNPQAPAALASFTTAAAPSAYDLGAVLTGYQTAGATTAKIQVTETAPSTGHRLGTGTSTTLTYTYDSAAKTWSAARTLLKGEKEGANPEQIIFQDEDQVIFKVLGKYDANTTNTDLDTGFTFNLGALVPGTDYFVLDANGSDITNQVKGTDGSVTVPAGSAQVQISLMTSALLVNGALNTITVNGTDTNKTDYVFVNSAQSISVTKDQNTGVYGLSPEAVTLDAEIEVSPVTEGTGTIVVSKQIRDADGKALYAQKNLTYYAALYRADGVTLAAEHQAITVSASNYTSSANATFSGMPIGTYVVKETDSAGNPLSGDGNLTISYSSQTVELTRDHEVINNGVVTYTADTKTCVITNRYNTPTSDFAGSGTFAIKLQVKDASGNALQSNLTGYFYVGGGGKHLKNNVKVVLTNDSAATKKDISFPMVPATADSTDMTVKLIKILAADGTDLSSKYTVDAATKTFTLKNKADNDPTVIFTLKPAASSDTATLTLTKAVTFHNTPVRVNGTYYIGIFQDAALKSRLFTKAMALSNASAKTATLKINLYKLQNENHDITLYFAEVDKNGNVVKSGKKAGYTISFSKSSVYLSPTQSEATVVCTNDVVDGSVASANLTNPSSGFAGDSSALAEAQSLANNESTASKPTGDNTPFIPLAIAVAASGAVLALAAVLLIRRKKKHSKNSD